MLQGREPRGRGHAVCWPNPECAHCLRCTVGGASYPGNRGPVRTRSFSSSRVSSHPSAGQPPSAPNPGTTDLGEKESKHWEKKIKTKLVTEEGKLRNSRMPSKFLFAKLLCVYIYIWGRSWALRTDLRFLCDFSIELEGTDLSGQNFNGCHPVALKLWSSGRCAKVT